MTSLVLRSVRKRYGGVAALDGVDLVVPPGSRTAIVGPSGSGKSTLLRIIAGFEAPDAGQVLLGGTLLADGPASVPAHRRGIGLVAQEGALFPHLSVADNIGFGLDGQANRAGRITQLADMVGLDAGMLARKPDQISGGQQQRVALARALARSPSLMLLDEPFSALDTNLRASTRKAVSTLLGAAGITTVLVTHDQAEALSFADQVAVMHDGTLLQAGTPHDLYLRPRNPVIAEFLGDALILPAQLGDGWADCTLGRIAVDAPSRRGPAHIMLRPEQVSLVPLSAAEAAPGGIEPLHQVTEVEFGGSVCLVTIRRAPSAVQDASTAQAPLVLRKSYVEAPPAGTIVRIVVTGAAHAFADPAA